MVPECQTKQTLNFKGKNPKYLEPSEWGELNCSGSLPVGGRNNSTYMRNRENPKELDYSDEESSSFENVCIGQCSREIAKYGSLNSKKNISIFQERNELGGPFCSVIGSLPEVYNPTSTGYKAQQISVLSSDKGSPLYRNVPIGPIFSRHRSF
ncbi:hypothetical protein NPIL_673131 [Nephila pilipes]|uniref:Uncharacterized protein n=1 Tax=Nephila pilipes TaxID=299642 RepID=A0A8X6U495_NEPPI|nr:hypothetical protein NPIL_673131 [Nephila pilipes]